MASKKPLVLSSGGIKQVIQSGDVVDTGSLGTGSASSSTWLRGDNTWSNTFTAGTINGMAIGGSTPAAATFTTVTVNSTLDVSSVATFTNTGLHLLDTDASHDLILSPGSNLTGDRTLTITTGDSNRIFSLSGDLTFAGAFTTNGAVTISTFGASLIDDADNTAARSTLGLVIGTDVQAYDATLAALAGANWAANSLAIGSGTDTVSQVTFAANTFPARSSSGNLVAKTITDFALTILDDSTDSAVRTTLGLGTIATQAASSVTITGGSIDGTTIGGSTPAAGSFTTLSATGQTTISLAGSTTNASLLFSGSTNNWISFGTTGQGAPTFTTRSVGTKVVLNAAVGASAVDYGLGYETDYLWFSTSTTSKGFKWYGGTTMAATLTGGGNLTLTGGVIGLTQAPSAWGSTGGAIEGYAGSLTFSQTGGESVRLMRNAYVAAGGLTRQYSDPALIFSLAESSFVFQVADTGAAGSSISIATTRLLMDLTGDTTFTAASNTDNNITLSGFGTYDSTINLGSNSSGTGKVGTTSGNFLLNAPTGKEVRLTINDTEVLGVASTGADVTGTLSSTGALTGATTLAIGGNGTVPSSTTAIIDLHTASSIPTPNSSTGLILANTASAGSGVRLQFVSGNTGTGLIEFGDTDAILRGRVGYDNNTDSLIFGTSNATAGTSGTTTRLTISSTGNATFTGNITAVDGTFSGNILAKNYTTVTKGSLMAYGGKNFNGTTTYLDGASPSGVSDGQVGSLVVFVRFASSASATEVLLSTSGTRFHLIRGTTGTISLTLDNPSNVNAATLTSTSAVAAAAGTYVIMMSWDLSAAAAGDIKRRIWINHVDSDNGTGTYNNDTIDYTAGDYSIGATSTGTSPFSGDIYMLWASTTQWIDFDIESLRHAFADDNNKPVYWGANGEIPTGTSPQFFHAYDGDASWHTNKGTATYTFTKNGANADATTALYGENKYVTHTGIETLTNKTVSDTLTLSAAGSATAPPLDITSATMPHIRFANNGAAAPTFTSSRSAGSKLVLNQAFSAGSSADYAIGYETDNIWFGVATTAKGFKWYGGTSSAMTLTGAGVLTVTSTLTATGGITSTAIGATGPSTGAFTTVTASGDATVSGAQTPPTIYRKMSWGGKNFNGSTTFLDANALTGIADGKAGTVAMVVRFANASGTSELLYQNTGGTVDIRRVSTGTLQVILRRADLTVIGQWISTSAVLTAAGTYTILISWNLASTGNFKAYVNDAAVTITTSTDTTADNIDYTVSEHAIGASGAGSLPFAGDFYILWFDYTQQLDFSVVNTRRKFIDANNVPAYLGAHGQLPTGTSPGLFLAYDDHLAWHINRGSLTSTTFSNNGANAAATTALTAEWVPYSEIGRSITITADHTVGRVENIILVNKTSAAVITMPSVTMGRTIRVVQVNGNFAVTAAATVLQQDGSSSSALLPPVKGAWCELAVNAAGTGWQITNSFTPMVHEVLTATRTVTADESGKTFYLNSATEFVTTLPAAALGLRFTFICSAAPSGASYTIVTNGSSNIIKGSVYTSDVNSATDADFETAGGDTITIVNSKAVAGDRVDLFSDGTSWFAHCFCTVFDGITITTAS